MENAKKKCSGISTYLFEFLRVPTGHIPSIGGKVVPNEYSRLGTYLGTLNLTTYLV